MSKSGSLTKIEVWRKTKEEVLLSMDKGKIDPTEADRILKFISTTLKMVSTIDDLGRYCAMLEEKFPILKSTIDSFRLQEEEKLDSAVGQVLDKLIKGG
ncbi:hypothetical protein HN709_00445, partial [Candidatus Peregrinibacteria bacterium]|nr:hypothetical protein [Candidatus Peregrinibacteria bacterium]